MHLIGFCQFPPKYAPESNLELARGSGGQVDMFRASDWRQSGVAELALKKPWSGGQEGTWDQERAGKTLAMTETEKGL